MPSNNITLMNAMNRLYAFMNDYKIDKLQKGKTKSTHNINGPPWGSYHIPDSKLSKFMEYYKIAAEEMLKTDNENLHIVEVPKKISPLPIDIDFKHYKSDRQYKLEHIKETINIYLEVIDEYFSLDNKEKYAYVFEKDIPTHDPKKNQYRDGFHIIFPNFPVDKDAKLLISYKALEKAKEKELFSDITLANNDLDTIFDISIHQGTGWNMYGSKKKDGNLYKLTAIYGIYKNKLKKFKCKGYSTLPILLSMRKYSDDIEVKYNYEKYDEDEIIDILNSITDKISPNKRSKNKKLKNKKSSIKKNNDNESDDDDVINKYDIEIFDDDELNDTELEARQLTELLSTDRAEGYGSWIMVCWALANISNKLKYDFFQFSSKKNFDPEGCDKMWDRGREYAIENKGVGLGIGSLRYWAKKDNPKGYTKFLNERLAPLIKEAESGTHSDIAKVLKEKYKDRFACSSIKKSIWYEFENNRWNEIDAGYRLMNIISDDLTSDLAHIISICYGKIHLNIDGMKSVDKDEEMSRADRFKKIIINLKSSSFKSRVMDECCRRFYIKDFEEKLDSDRNLIGFENGVYDLKNRIFREGLPEDYITFSTGYDYKEYSLDHEYVIGLRKFFEKVQTEKELREYVLDLLASHLEGNVRSNRFIIWTGSGCHLKGTPIRMVDGSVKKVENIKIGDKLMGDDSKERNVKELFRGKDYMYEIQPFKSNFDSFIVNKNHVLSLMNIHTKEIVDIKLCEIIENINKYELKDLCLFKNKTFYDFKETEESSYDIGSKLESLDELDDNYIRNSYEKRNELIKGIIDNYSKSENNKYIISITQNTNILKKVKELFDSMATNYDISNYFYDNNKHTHIYIINKSEFTDEKQYIFSDFRFSYYGEDDYYGFELDGNHRYMMEDSTITHNSNGKSTVTEFFKSAFGDYCDTVPVTLITRKMSNSGSATPELAGLRGKRFVMFQEPEEKDKIYVGNMKMLTGKDEVFARPLYKDPYKYIPQFKLMLSCNELPNIPSDDNGTWRRIRVTPWESEFKDHDDVLEDPTKHFYKDPTLEDKLKKWKGAFMWYLIKYHFEGKELDKNPINEPDKVKFSTNKYRNDTNFYNEFLDEEIQFTKDPDDYIPFGHLYEVFKKWYDQSYSSKNIPPKKELFSFLKGRKFKMRNNKLIEAKLKDLIEE